jgi:glutaryl-CoA dehydrogenase
MQKFEKIGAFGLTEPEVGSGAAGGLTVTCKKTPEGWILNGQKNGSEMQLCRFNYLGKRFR